MHLPCAWRFSWGFPLLLLSHWLAFARGQRGMGSHTRTCFSSKRSQERLASRYSHRSRSPGSMKVGSLHSQDANGAVLMEWHSQLHPLYPGHDWRDPRGPRVLSGVWSRVYSARSCEYSQVWAGMRIRTQFWPQLACIVGHGRYVCIKQRLLMWR